MTAYTTVSSSGDADIDGVLSGVRWASGAITYSFTTSSSQYGYAVPGFQAFNSAQQAATQAALANYAAVGNLVFTKVSGGNGTLRFAESSDPPTAYAYLPYSDEFGGDAFFNHTDYNSAPKGSYSYLTFLHEIGHTLGLDHGQDGRAALPTDHDSLEYSVMTYRSFVGADLNGYTVDEGSYPTTLMMADIAAIQFMYGANYSTNSGNSTYRWDPATGELKINGASQGGSITNTIFMTVWDGGGTDTYDFSAYTTNLSINLTPGEWTITSAAQRADLGFGEYARGNIANAMLYQDKVASLIENAIGGAGNDLIVGNQGANDLKGGGGNDSLKGLAGNDTIWGGSGDDTCYFTVASTACVVTYDATAQAYIVTAAGGGTDTVKQVEFFAFTDLTIAAGVITPDAPILMSTTPADDTKNVARNANIVLVFSEDVVAGAGKLVIRQSDGTIFQSFDLGTGADGVTIAGDTVTIDPTEDFKSGTGYYLTIDAGAFNDDEGKSFAGIAGKTDFNFTIEGTLASEGRTRIGTAQAERINGTKNADHLYGGGGNDSVVGKSGDDFIDGGRGADNMSGGRGDDTYVVNSAKDKVVEAARQGTDLVKSSVSYTLSANVEDLKLTGSGNTAGTGNAEGNTITGNGGKNTLSGKAGRDSLDGKAGNDKLDGGNGHDTLTGGSGADKFVFTAKAKASNADVITDFDTGRDTIVLAHKIFKALAKGDLAAGDFALSTDGDAAAAHLVYNSATGALFYDKDGSGGAGDVRIATLSTGLALTHESFLIV